MPKVTDDCRKNEQDGTKHDRVRVHVLVKDIIENEKYATAVRSTKNDF